ncbi:MAG: PrsW family glutamic-type intramembrane protease [Anaerolineales bacterium]
MSDENKVQADNNSIAIGNLSAGGNISGNIHIGNTTVYQYASEEDVPITNDEIETGLTRFAEFVPERAPVLQEQFNSIAKRLRATLTTDINALSPSMKMQQEDEINRMKLISMEVLDISFRALCQGKNPPPYDSRPPFLGLFAFKPEDKDFFFGRDALVLKLVKRIKQYPFLAVTGASGSGKSSLVMAGLIPMLEAKMIYLTPSSTPLYQLRMAKSNSDKDSIFVVDQFEELFTLTPQTKEREEFINELLEITKTNRVIITMRADFWGEVATHKELKQAMLEHQELIAPMDTEELHEAAQKQAATVGLRLAPTLSESILEDVKDEPGAMPLLQHALWLLWKRRHGLWLKTEEYSAFGGIQRAIAKTADEFYENFSPEDRERMRNVFVRLTRLNNSGKTAQDTRRRVKIRELIYLNDTVTQTTEFIRKLADARLLITSAETLKDEEVEVAHEALIRNWPRLRGWLDEDRLSLLVQEQVHDAASVWEASDGDADAITHQGGKLEDALHLLRNPRVIFNEMEKKYLQACQKRDRKIGKSIREIFTRWLFPILVVSGVLFVFVPLAFVSPKTSLATLLALAIGTTIPLLTAFFIYQQDRYRIVETKWVIACLLGGMFAYVLAANINPAIIEYGILSTKTLIQYAAPVMETTLKGFVLYLIMSRLKFSRMVDGVVYGAAIGAGFAALENYEYILVHDSTTAIIIATIRVFSTNLVHMGVLGISGLLLVTAQFDKKRLLRSIKILGALTVPSVIASIFNIMVNSSVALIAAIAFGISLILILCIIIRHLIGQEEKWISHFLQGENSFQSNSALNNVERIAKAIRELFGVVRAAQVERYLILQARRGILQRALDDMDNTKWKSSMEEQIRLVKKRIRGSRAALGTYCWENVKAVIPEISKIAES